jgi:uncharacterized protein
LTRKHELSSLKEQRDEVLSTISEAKIAQEHLRMEYQEMLRKGNKDWEAKLEQRESEIRAVKEQYEQEHLDLLIRLQSLQKEQDVKE